MRFFLVFCGLTIGFFAVAEPLQDPFQWGFDGSTRSVTPGAEIPVEVSLSAPDGYFLYQDKISLGLTNGEGFQLSPVELPAPIKRKDPFFGKIKEVYYGDLTVRAKLKAPAVPGEHLAKLLLTYQGCSQTLCYRQMKQELLLPVKVAAVGGEQKGFGLKIGLSFIGGLITDFTPCVLPIIPITLAFIGVRKGSSRGKNFYLTFIFILAMAFSYALLGMAAALLGKNLGFLFQSPFFLGFVILLYLLLALSLFGLFEIQLPLAVRNGMAKMGGQGTLGASLAGFTVGFLAAPCVGPLIASLLLYVAQEREIGRGFLLLFSYGLGMGSLFLVIALFYEALGARVHGGSYTVWIKRAMAVLLLLPVLYYGSILWPQVRRHHEVRPAPADFWKVPQEGFSLAAVEKKPILIDFYATWCLPCLEMEQKTFADPTVREALRKMVPIKVDCTSETADCKEMTERYGVVGWPTVIFLDPKGKVREKIVGRLIGPEEMVQLISRYSE